MYAYLTQGKNGIHYFHIDHNASCLHPPPPPPPPKKKTLYNHCFRLFWGRLQFARELKTMVMQNSRGGGGGGKAHYGLWESINKLNDVLSFVMEK